MVVRRSHDRQRDHGNRRHQPHVLPLRSPFTPGVHSRRADPRHGVRDRASEPRVRWDPFAAAGSLPPPSTGSSVCGVRSSTCCAHPVGLDRGAPSIFVPPLTSPPRSNAFVPVRSVMSSWLCPTRHAAPALDFRSPCRRPLRAGTRGQGAVSADLREGPLTSVVYVGSGGGRRGRRAGLSPPKSRRRRWVPRRGCPAGVSEGGTALTILESACHLRVLPTRATRWEDKPSVARRTGRDLR